MTIATLRDVRSASSGHPLQDQENQGNASAHTAQGRVKSIVLAVAGVGGLLCIVWLIAALVFGLSVIVFKTGSMAPTMPTGSAAITRSVVAADIRVGDVVTVPVPGDALPVTHRVVSIRKDAAAGADRILVLKGDDNLIADQAPYTVREARLVIFSLPGAGTALALARTPLFIGLITMGIVSLLLWAFWPSAAVAGSEITSTASRTSRNSQGDQR
jgi:signal peptidase